MPQRADPARSEKAGQVSKVADQGSGCIAGAEHDPVGDHLYLAGWADLRGGENGEKERVRCDYERRTSGKT